MSFTHREGLIGNTGVFRIDPVTNQITILAGGGTDSTPNNGDSATDLALFTPNGLAFDAAGNLIFVDTGETLLIQVGDANAGVLDVTGNGNSNPFQDGILIVRFMLGQPDANLENPALIPNDATRTTARRFAPLGRCG